MDFFFFFFLLLSIRRCATEKKVLGKESKKMQQQFESIKWRWIRGEWRLPAGSVTVGITCSAEKTGSCSLIPSPRCACVISASHCSLDDNFRFQSALLSPEPLLFSEMIPAFSFG